MVLKITNLHILKYLPTCWLYLLECYTIDNQRCTHTASEKQGEDYNLVDWYLDVLRKYKDKLLRITRYVVADAWFSKAKFVGEACLLGFHVISRLRDDAALWYAHDGVRTGKRGRPRIKGEKIDF